MIRKLKVIAASCAILAAMCSTMPTSSRAQSSLADQDISNAYIYLLGRLLVTRQQQLDFKEGFKWNELVHRKPGAVDWPNPNLDVAYSEAWVAVDESSCTIVSVPKIEGRYYTVHFLNGWGETIANINERFFPKRPFGEFAMCLRGADVAIPHLPFLPADGGCGERHLLSTALDQGDVTKSAPA